MEMEMYKQSEAQWRTYICQLCMCLYIFIIESFFTNALQSADCNLGSGILEIVDPYILAYM